MTILGVESAIFGVDEFERTVQFWTDYGLEPVSSTADEAVFEVATGSKVVVRRRNDPRLPAQYFDWPGVRETIWGVDTQESLERLAADLGRDRELRTDPDGTVHFVADDGTPMGLRVWHKRTVVSAPDEVNAPGAIRRMNQLRKWRTRAKPKAIAHVVFFVKDYVGASDFYRERLGFRYVDHSRGVGVFLRADGTFEHHTVFLADCSLPGFPGTPGFMHIAFSVEDIDEVMAGVEYMRKKGWNTESRNTKGGLSRHRISSAIYYYWAIPGFGEAEYNADTDYLDDGWVPRVWDFKFGSLLWAHHTMEFFKNASDEWDVKFDPHGASLEEFRKTPKVKRDRAA